MQRYSKAIAAILAGLATLGTAYGMEEPPAELIAAMATVLGTVFVYFAPANADKAG